MKPEALPVIKGKYAKKFEQLLEHPLTPDQLEVFREADEVVKKIKRIE
ncbi:MAG TPA: hypothetical protein VKK79_26145 [Candidatus Lokiarchaeia archaeon]|nr:hypothetical protein [Candidatus Lokiarchaeia archaeon]